MKLKRQKDGFIVKDKAVTGEESIRYAWGIIKNKPLIRKKDKDTQGNTRYVIQMVVNGKMKVISLNPTKIWTMLNSPEITK